MQALQVRRFRCLSHEFTVAADRPEDLATVDVALSAFASRDESDVPAVTYELRNGPDGEYALIVDGARIRVSDDPLEPLDLLFWYVGEHTVRAEQHRLLLHAGAVVAPDGRRAMLLPGASGSGKSTTTYGLVSAGFDYLSDEFAVVDPDDSRVSAFARPIALKMGSRGVLPEVDALALLATCDGVGTAHVPAERVGRHAGVGRYTVQWVVWPRYVPGAESELTVLTPGETCVELLRSTFQVERRPGQALRAMARLASHAEGYRMVVGELGSAVRLIQGLTRTPQNE